MTRDTRLLWAYLLLFLAGACFARALLEIPTAVDGDWYPLGFWVALSLLNYNGSIRQLERCDR